MKKYNLLLIVLSSLLIFSCGKNYLETIPSASVDQKDMLSSLTGVETVLDGINRGTFYYYGAHDRFGQKTMDYIIDCLGEDFYPTEDGYGWFVAWYKWIEHRSKNSGNLEFVWAYYYDIINNANLIIDNLEKMQVLVTEENKKSVLLAQAYTYRGYSLYYLVQLFGEKGNGVPVPTKSNPEPMARETIAKVYEQINKDLNHAVQLFDQGQNLARKNVSQINKSVANAIRARVALTEGRWEDAANYAALAKNGFSLSDDYMYGWNKANPEWIWGALLIDEQQTSYASFFSHIDPFFGGYCTLGNHHVMSKELFDFLPAMDTRKLLHQPELFFPPSYLSNYFGNKARVGFKFTGMGDWTNDYIYIKAGEMYLIEAEAYARLGNAPLAQKAINDLNLARTYADAKPDYEPITSTGDELLQTILMYRRAELWGDGQRFLDIKRLGLNMSGREGQPLAEQTAKIQAGDKMFTFLIPQQEMDSNPNMIQNEL